MGDRGHNSWIINQEKCNKLLTVDCESKKLKLRELFVGLGIRLYARGRSVDLISFRPDCWNWYNIYQYEKLENLVFFDRVNSIFVLRASSCIPENCRNSSQWQNWNIPAPTCRSPKYTTRRTLPPRLQYFAPYFRAGEFDCLNVINNPIYPRKKQLFKIWSTVKLLHLA